MENRYEKYRNYVKFIEDYRGASNAASGSKFDANANVENKNVTTCTGEIPKGDLIGINRLLMTDKLTEMYGEDVAAEYIRQLDDHEIYKHDETNPCLPYCVSITMYPFLFEGLNSIGGISDAPKNVDSFAGAFINLVFAVASQFAGAVSTPEFLTYLDYFLRKEYGDTYYRRSDHLVEYGLKPRTIKDKIEALFQQVVYSLNQPAAARNFQSVFWNIAYFDRPYFNGIFKGFVFPDGSEPMWDSVNWLQKFFMNWFNEERLKKIITFPVETVNLLTDGTDFVDQEWKNFTAEMWSRGHSFFCYQSNSVDSLSSCCFAPDTKVLVRTDNGVEMKAFWELSEYTGKIQVLSNGKFADARLVKLPARDMYEIITSANDRMVVTDNHQFPTPDGLKTAEELKKGDLLLTNAHVLESKKAFGVDEDYYVGARVGMVLAGHDSRCSGAKDISMKYTTKGHVNGSVFEQSSDFRRGLLHGMKVVCNEPDIYVPTEDLAQEVEAIYTSLGELVEIVYDAPRGVFIVQKRPDLAVSIDGERYVEITTIRPIVRDYDYVYCFEMRDYKFPYFTLPNGIVTHNCRLRNEIQENTFSFTLGAGGVSTGSKGVITINVNRLVQDAWKNNRDLSEAVEEQVAKIHKYLTAYNEIVKDNFNHHMLPIYDAGYISLDKQYLTIGINGFVEGAEFLGIDISPNDRYFEYGEMILRPIYEANKAARTKELMFNTEFVPAENLGIKNAKWDKEAGYFSPRECYNSYFYKVEDDSTNIIDKFILHGSKLTKYLDGGSALHANLDEHLSKAQYLLMLDTMVKTGCSYATFNIPNTICNKCGHIDKHNLKVCPKCGSEDLDYATRIIGYLKRVSKFSEGRQKEAKQRFYAKEANIF